MHNTVQEYAIYHSQVVPGSLMLKVGLQGAAPADENYEKMNLNVNQIKILCQIRCRAAGSRKKAVLKVSLSDVS